ncbi:hypothetical protein CRYUN_Cryun07bG0053000 [Craigia yunnanensis]
MEKKGSMLKTQLLISANTLENLIKAQTKPVTGEQFRGIQRWRPPGTDNFKVNFDGSLEKERKRRGISVVIRNSEGAFMGSNAARINNVMDPFTIEALAAVEQWTSLPIWDSGK